MHVKGAAYIHKSALMRVKGRSLCTKKWLDACKEEEPMCKSILMRVKGRSLCVNRCIDVCEGKEHMCK